MPEFRTYLLTDSYTEIRLNVDRNIPRVGVIRPHPLNVGTITVQRHDARTPFDGPWGYPENYIEKDLPIKLTGSYVDRVRVKSSVASGDKLLVELAQ